jgi:hypothetical protein
MRLVIDEPSREAGIEVSVLERHDGPDTLRADRHVEELALLSAQIDRIKRPRARNTRPPKLDRINVSTVCPTRRHANQAPDASPRNRAPDVFYAYAKPQRLAAVAQLPTPAPRLLRRECNTQARTSIPIETAHRHKERN